MGFQEYGLGAWISGLGFGSLRFRDWVVRVWGFGFRVWGWGFGMRVWGFGVWGFGIRVWRFWGLGFRD